MALAPEVLAAYGLQPGLQAGLRTASSPAFSEEEQNSLMRDLFGYGGSVLGGIGSVLDTYSGAGSLRDVLAGENPFDQLIDPLNESKRVTGRELARHHGFVGSDDNWGNFGAGLALEIGLDPLTYLSGGATALSKLGKVSKFLHKPEYLSAIGRGKAGLRVGGGGDDVLKLAAEADSFKSVGKSNLQRLDEGAAEALGLKDYIHKPMQLKSGLKSGEAFEQLRTLEGDSLGTSFKYFGKGVGKGAKAERVAEFSDKIADAIVHSKVGQGVQYVFEPAIKGVTSQFSKLGQRLMRISGNADLESRVAAKAKIREMFRLREEAGGKLGKDDNALRQYLEVANPLNDEVDQAVETAYLLAGADPEPAKKLLHLYSEQRDDMVRVNHKIGNDVPEYAAEGLMDKGYHSIYYVTRANEFARVAKGASGKTGRVSSTADANNIQRISAFEGAPRGTVEFLEAVNDVSDHSKVLNDLVDKYKDLLEQAGHKDRSRRIPLSVTQKTGAIAAVRGDIVRHLNKHWGKGTLPEPWRTRAPVVETSGGPLTKQWVSPRERITRRYTKPDGSVGDRYTELADELAKYTRDERVAGLYGNDPLIDLENRMIRGWESTNVAKSALRLFAMHAADDFGAYGDRGTSIKSMLQERNLSLIAGDETAGALSEIHRTLVEEAGMRPFAQLDDVVDEAGEIVSYGAKSDLPIPEGILNKLGLWDTPGNTPFREVLDLIKDQPQPVHKFLDNYATEAATKNVKGINDDILREVESLIVPTELVDTLERVHEAHSPQQHNAFWAGIDSYTSWFKSVNTVLNSIPPLSAFAVRNWYAGQYNNWVTGNFSLKSLRDSWDFWAGKDIQGASQWSAVRREVIDRAQQEVLPESVLAKTRKMKAKERDAFVKEYRNGKTEAALKKLNDKDATKILEDIAYRHNVLGDNLGSIETGALRPERISQVTPQKMPVREELPGDTFAQQLGSFTKQTGRRALALEEGLSFNPTHVRGVGEAKTFPEQFHVFRAGAAQQDTRFGLMKAGEGINGMVESSNRGTAFFHQLEHGVEPAEAALKTNALQVDYSWRNYTDTERNYLTRVFPFYKWTRQMLPFTLKEIMQKPGGKIAQTIRAQNRLAGSGSDQYVPDRVASQGLAIPLGEQDAEGNQKFLQQIDLPAEGATEPFKLGPSGQGFMPFIGGTLSGTLRGLGGSMHPLPKSVIESATGVRMFDGRDLQRLDGGLARIYSNVGNIITSITGKEVPKTPATLEGLKAGGMENILWSMVGGPLSKLRTLTDEPLTGVVKKLINVGTGGRITDINVQQMREIEAQQKLIEMLRGRPGMHEFTKPYTRAEDLDLVSDEDRQLLELLNALRKKPE